MIASLIASVLTVIVIISLFSGFSKEDDKSSPTLMLLIAGFGLFVGITAYGLSVAYFQKAETLLNFLLFFTMVVLFPLSMVSAAVTVANVRNLRETIAAA